MRKWSGILGCRGKGGWQTANADILHNVAHVFGPLAWIKFHQTF